MGDHSAIEWTDATWNPVTGCTRVSAGCDNCYAARQAATRLRHMRQYRELAVITPGGRAAFNGTIRLLPERLDQPLRWTRPRRVFVNSMSDLFHTSVPEDYIDAIFAIMALSPQHTFQVLTKRPERMLAYLSEEGRPGAVAAETGGGVDGDRSWPFIRPDDLADRWPLANVWLGISCEDQATADERIPLLLETPAAVRFISAEPLLGPLDLSRVGTGPWFDPLNGWGLGTSGVACTVPSGMLSWVIVGGESGAGARPMDPAWARVLRDQCVGSGVPFFFKQWGGRTPKAGGRELEGRTWDEMPRTEVRA